MLRARSVEGEIARAEKEMVAHLTVGAWVANKYSYTYEGEGRAGDARHKINVGSVFVLSIVPVWRLLARLGALL